MRVSYRWLSRVLGVDVPLGEVLDRLMRNGLEIESVLDCGAESGKIIAAKILEIAPHPNAENLVLCKVQGAGAEPLRIVCGAKNMKAGDLVPLAVEGAKLPGGMVIKRSKIRGEESQGMMCSGRELGWGEDSSGLLILPQDGTYAVGKPFDAIIDIKVTPNRSDCLSVFGIARDLAASLGYPSLKFPAHDVKESGAPASESAKVKLEAPAACPRYTGRIIRGVTVGLSPLWLQRAVESAGLRSINNVVDVTNFILLELGHPIHAFDLAKVAGGTVVVRMARDGEEVTTLDGQVARLAPSDLLIADPQKAIALAGIMGCGNSEISSETRDVFLECAYFTPSVVRRTSKRLAKSTDSSYRFERGTDWDNLPAVVDRAAKLIAEVAGGNIASGMFDERGQLPERSLISITSERINALLGTSLSNGEILAPLESLGFELDKWGDENAPGGLTVSVPTFRPDVTCDADVAEEIARMMGYEAIPSELPRIRSRAAAQSREAQLADLIREIFVRAGFHEAWSYSFLSAESLARADSSGNASVALKNPLSAEYAVMRSSLLPGLLESVVYNQNHGAGDVRLFEVGTVFSANPAGGVTENLQFAAVIVGAAREGDWRGAAKPAEFFDGKAIAEDILAALGIEGCSWERPGEARVGEILHPGKSAVCKRENKTLLAVGELHPGLRARLDLRREAVAVWGDFEDMIAFVGRVPESSSISQFPTVARDLALVAASDMAAAEIESVIRRRAKSALAGIRLFDVYEGDRIAAGSKSLAYELRFGAVDRTMTDDEVNQLIERILADLKSKLCVELRT